MSQFENKWGAYAYEALLRDAGHNEAHEACAVRIKKKPKFIDFERDEYDLPLLEPLKPDINTAEINIIIRSFIVIHYSEQ